MDTAAGGVWAVMTAFLLNRLVPGRIVDGFRILKSETVKWYVLPCIAATAALIHVSFDIAIVTTLFLRSTLRWATATERGTLCASGTDMAS